MDTIKRKIIDEIKVAMYEKRINQSELSRRLKIQRAYTSRILRGKVNVTIDTLAKIARALGKRCVITLNPLGESAPVSDVEVLLLSC